MIKKTILKEIKELYRDGLVMITALIILVLLVFSVWISYNQYVASHNEFTLATSTERSVWENQGEKNPHSASHYGTYVFKPKHPLSLLDQGLNTYTGSTIFLESHNRNEATYSEVADQTGLARFGQLSPDFILLFIIPVLIILIGYNSFTKEKEMGTMGLLKSQGVIFSKLMIGKWIAIFLPIMLFLFALFVLSGIILSSIEGYLSFSWTSLGVLFLIYLIYYAIFVNVVLFVSQRVTRSGVSLVMSLSIWIISCLAVPKIASNFAGSKYPYPTRQVFSENVLNAKKELLNGHNPWSEEAKSLQKEVLAEYGVDSLQHLPFNFTGYLMQKGEEYEAKVYKEQYDILKSQFKKQASTYNSLSAMSPFLPVRFLSMAIAYTDYDAHWDFSDATEDYRIATQKFLNGDLANNSKYGERGYVANSETWKKLPKFNYKPLELFDILNHQKTAVFSLLGWFFLTSVLLFIFKKQY